MNAASVTSRIATILLFVVLTLLHAIGLMMVVGAVADIVFSSPVGEWSQAAKAWGLVAITGAAVVIVVLEWRDDEDIEG